MGGYSKPRILNLAGGQVRKMSRLPQTDGSRSRLVQTRATRTHNSATAQQATPRRCHSSSHTVFSTDCPGPWILCSSATMPVPEPGWASSACLGCPSSPPSGLRGTTGVCVCVCLSSVEEDRAVLQGLAAVSKSQMHRANRANSSLSWTSICAEKNILLEEKRSVELSAWENGKGNNYVHSQAAV